MTPTEPTPTPDNPIPPPPSEGTRLEQPGDRPDDEAGDEAGAGDRDNGE